MRPAVLVLLVVSSAASAQPALFPNGPGRRIPAAAHWRAAVGAGMIADGTAGVVSLGAERTLGGPFALGLRGAAYARTVWETDTVEPASVNWAAEALASVATRDRLLDLRAFAGAGLAAVEYPIASWEPGAPGRGSELRPHVLAGAGVDVYLTPGVGLGVEGRVALSDSDPRLSEASLGLRVRLPR